MPGNTEDSATPAPDGIGERGSEPGVIHKFLKFLTDNAAGLVGAIGLGVGGTIANDLQHRQLLMFAALAGLVAIGSALYVWQQARTRPPRARPGEAVREAKLQAVKEAAAQAVPQAPRIPSLAGAGHDPAGDDLVPPPPDYPPAPGRPASPAPPGAGSGWLRLLRVVAVMCALVGGTFFLGYWTLGYGFARGLLDGLMALAGMVVLLSGVAAVAQQPASHGVPGRRAARRDRPPAVRQDDGQATANRHADPAGHRGVGLAPGDAVLHRVQHAHSGQGLATAPGGEPGQERQHTRRGAHPRDRHPGRPLRPRGSTGRIVPAYQYLVPKVVNSTEMSS
jgi:hypothetical protein